MPINFDKLKHARIGPGGTIVHFMLMERVSICGAGNNSTGLRRSAGVFGRIYETTAPVTCRTCLAAQARAKGNGTVAKPTKRTFTVTLPNGTVAKRTSARPYTHVVAVRFADSPDPKWWCEWRSDKRAAEQRAAYWQHCPATRPPYNRKFETKIIEVNP